MPKTFLSWPLSTASVIILLKPSCAAALENMVMWPQRNSGSGIHPSLRGYGSCSPIRSNHREPASTDNAQHSPGRPAFSLDMFTKTKHILREVNEVLLSFRPWLL